MYRIYNPITALCCLGMLIFANLTIAQQKTLTLEEAKQMALTNNREIQQAEQHVAAASAAKSAANAANKPTVDGSLFGLYLGEPMSTMLPETSVNGSVAVSEVLYAGGKIKNGRKIAESAYNLQTSQQALTQSEVLLNTESAYWNLLSMYEQVKLAKKYLASLDTLLTDVTNKYEVGFINKNDMLRVKVKMNTAEISLQEAQDGLEISKRSFAQMIGLNTLDFVLAEDLNTIDVLPELLDDPDIFVSQRPEVAMLEEAVAMQTLQTSLLKGDRRPSVAVSVNGIYSAGKNIDFSDGSNQFTSAIGVVSLSVPILDWGARKHNVKEQEAQTEVQKLELENTKELIAIEIRNANLELNRAIKQVALSKESLQQAEENLRLLNDHFKAGIITGKDVLEGQVLWQSAYAQLIEAKTSLKINEATYQKVIAAY